MPKRPGGPLARRRGREVAGLVDDAALHAVGRFRLVHATDSLDVAARFFEHESTAAAAELRMREMQMGCCWSGRPGLQLRYIARVADSGDEGSLAQLDDYRNL